MKFVYRDGRMCPVISTLTRKRKVNKIENVLEEAIMIEVFNAVFRDVTRLKLVDIKSGLCSGFEYEEILVSCKSLMKKGFLKIKKGRCRLSRESESRFTFLPACNSNYGMAEIIDNKQ